jgi:hypothetical protein
MMMMMMMILITITDSKCRLCIQFGETAEHIISACPVLQKDKYTKRHDRVWAQLHFNICKEIGVKLDNEHWHDHVLKLVKIKHEGKVTVLCN